MQVLQLILKLCTTLKTPFQNECYKLERMRKRKEWRVEKVVI